MASSSLPELGPQLSSPGVFLVLRRMRVPLIVLIVIFAVSVLGLSLIPGQDAQGRPDRMGIFDAFYFMSYTATTIGFGATAQLLVGVAHLLSGARREADLAFEEAAR